MFDPRYCPEALLDRLVKHGQRRLGIPCAFRIDPHDISIVDLEAKILILEIGETPGEQGSAN